MSLAFGDTRFSLENRKEFLKTLGIDYRSLVCARQVHRCHAEYIEENQRGRGALSYDTAIPSTDALITNKKDVALAVFTADCLSVFLFDRITQSVGLIHAGWKSSKEKIVLKTLSLMQERFNTAPQDLYVGFGPSIKDCCYEVGEDFKNFFPGALKERNGRHYLDLVLVNKRQLIDCGVKEENMSDSNICTSCNNKDFFSYRREGKDCGRMMSVMMLK